MQHHPVHFLLTFLPIRAVAINHFKSISRAHPRHGFCTDISSQKRKKHRTIFPWQQEASRYVIEI
jgi:hypothetical protein